MNVRRASQDGIHVGVALRIVQYRLYIHSERRRLTAATVQCIPAATSYGHRESRLFWFRQVEHIPL